MEVPAPSLCLGKQGNNLKCLGRTEKNGKSNRSLRVNLNTKLLTLTRSLNNGDVDGGEALRFAALPGIDT
jgi:hypothetical protein